MSHNITVEGGTSVRLPTAGKYCDRDIVVTATGGTEDLNDVLTEQEALIAEMQAVLAEKASGAEKYTGSYEVTPKVTAQTLPTKDKLMREDVVVREIPITRVSNTSGGNTIIIG